MTVYVHLFHGRDSLGEELEDWGFEGPVIGPLESIHVTYMCDVNFVCDVETFRKFWPEKAAEWDASGVSNIDGPTVQYNLEITEGLIAYGGKFYGDWSITTSPEAAPAAAA